MEILKDHKQISSLTWIGSQYQFSVIIALRRELEYLPSLHFDIFWRTSTCPLQSFTKAADEKEQENSNGGIRTQQGSVWQT